MQRPGLLVVESPRRTSSRRPQIGGFGSSASEDDGSNRDEDAVLFGASSGEEADLLESRRRATLTGKAMHPSAFARISTSSSISQLDQHAKPVNTRSARSRSTTAPSPTTISRPSLSTSDRPALSQSMRASSSRLHSSNASVSTVSTSDSKQARSVRSRSQTESSGYATSITRPSVDSSRGRPSTSSMWSTSNYPSMPKPGTQYEKYSRPLTAPPSPDFPPSTFTPYSMTYSASATSLSMDAPSDTYTAAKSTNEPATGWKAMARKASGKFKRSISIPHNTASAMDIQFTAGSSSATSPSELSRSTSSSIFFPPSPKAPRTRSKTVSANSSDVETDGSTGSGGLLGSFLSRKKSSNTLRAERAERNRAWSQLPPNPLPSSPSTPSIYATTPTSPPTGKVLRHKSSKLSIGTGKGKQRLDEVVVSPFDVQFLTSTSSTKPTPYTSEPEEIPRPSLSASTSRPRPKTPPPINRSVSHDSGSTARQSITPTNAPIPGLSAPLPRSLSANSTSSSSPRSPSSSSQILSPSLSTTSLTSASSLAEDDSNRPPVPPLPMQHRPESPAAKSIKFPSTFGFVPRPEEEDDQFGSSASAASIPLPLMRRLERPARHDSMTSLIPVQEKKKKTFRDFDDMLEDMGTIKISVGEMGQVVKKVV